jgi:hypothetical protein
MTRKERVHIGKEIEKGIRKGTVVKRRKKEMMKRIQVDLTQEVEAEVGVEVDHVQNHHQNLFRFRIQNVLSHHSHIQEIKKL